MLLLFKQVISLNFQPNANFPAKFQARSTAQSEINDRTMSTNCEKSKSLLQSAITMFGIVTKTLIRTVDNVLQILFHAHIVATTFDVGWIESALFVLVLQGALICIDSLENKDKV